MTGNNNRNQAWYATQGPRGPMYAALAFLGATIVYQFSNYLKDPRHPRHKRIAEKKRRLEEQAAQQNQTPSSE